MGRMVLKDWRNGVGIPRTGSPEAFKRSVRITLGVVSLQDRH